MAFKIKVLGVKLNTPVSPIRFSPIDRCKSLGNDDISEEIAATHNLNLSSNKELKVFSAIYRNLKELRYLDLSNTGITKIPSWVGEFKKLQTLNLNGTPIQDLPKELEKCANLTVLLMNCPNIIPANVRCLKNVTLVIP